MSQPKTAIVVPNWNGAEDLPACLDSLAAQTEPADIVVVDNGSSDNSVSLLESKYPNVKLLRNRKNLGFAGGVNTGIRYALERDYDLIALFNNDAVADKEWLRHLVKSLEGSAGIATSKICAADKSHLDSTGDIYTTWGLPFPRGRGEPISQKYDKATMIFGASGGASLYKSEMLKQIGLFDEAFFAYYEDVDISFRAQLAGWKVVYVPDAICYHAIGATSSKIKDFTTYQTMKNLPMLFWKNVPRTLLPVMLPRFYIAYNSFYVSALGRGQLWPALRGELAFTRHLPHVLAERRRIQKNRRVADDYIKSILTWDLPPNAAKLRRLRAGWRRLARRAV